MKRSQIQMGESIAILFIFFIMVVFGFVFYMNVLEGSVDMERKENTQLRAIGVAQRASFLPELQCSRDNVRDDDCIDLLRLGAASLLLEENRIYYYDVFEFSRIWVEEIYPGDNIWPLYDNTLSNYSSKLSTFIPVSLFNATSEKYAFGILGVEVYR